jgi:hypothetical protein
MIMGRMCLENLKEMVVDLTRGSEMEWVAKVCWRDGRLHSVEQFRLEAVRRKESKMT